MKLVAVDKEGNVVEPGSEVIGSQGEPRTLLRATRANGTGYDGKVRVRMPDGSERVYYARVFGLEVREAD